MITGTTIVLGIVLLFALVIILMTVKIVPAYQRIVVLRLGKFNGVRGDGLQIIVPFIDTPIWVDVRENFIEIPQQTCITKDNAPINVDFLIYWKVVDPASSVIQVRNFMGAAQGIAMTTLRAVIGDLSLDEVLAKRDQINTVLRTKLDEVTERWGIKITTVEIREIQPPREVQDAMNKQMAAERNRRAVVTQAGGEREAAIMVAEGQKQSEILKAEGERQSSILRAEGYALSISKVYEEVKKVDEKTMAIQYLEAFKTLGHSASTKWIIPLEFTQLIAPVLKNLEGANKK